MGFYVKFEISTLKVTRVPKFMEIGQTERQGSSNFDIDRYPKLFDHVIPSQNGDIIRLYSLEKFCPEYEPARFGCS